MNPIDVAERYFAAIRARDIDGLMALYAEEASFTLPTGTTATGKDAIRALHESVFAAGAPFPTPMAMVAGESAIAVEIEARLPDGTVRNTANFYTLDQTGRIARLSVYTRTG